MNREATKINREATGRLGGLNEMLRERGYTDKERETILVRLLLCFFSQDTGVFGPHSFYRYLEKRRDMTPWQRLRQLFLALHGARPSDLPDELRDYPVLSATLFAEELPERELDEFFILSVLQCEELPWRSLSPAIFGAMFQEIMNQDDRREWGAYYTSEEYIDRLIDPLFMEELLKEREACRGSRRKLSAFQDKLCRLTFLDPACGCGNFLIRIYERLRLLELDVIEELYDTRQRVLDISLYCHLSVIQFLGIELEPFQAQVARIGLWLAERQMDLLAAERFGIDQVVPTMISPLGIRVGNALTEDWSSLISRERLSYIVGNPPFVGARRMNESQKLDMKLVFRGTRALGNLDYVTAWYRKAAEFMSGTSIRAAFVSTNSVSQGEQAAILWRDLTHILNMRIDFAWKTFVWNNGVRGQAKVHCVIIGFSDAQMGLRGEQYRTAARLYDEEGCRLVSHINAYLAPGPDLWITARRKPVSEVPEMSFGSMANDGGNLILSAEERRDLLGRYPHTRPWIRPFLGSAEFINGKERYCLWLAQEDPKAYLEIPEIAERIRLVREFRQHSVREATRELALFPERFGEIRQPESGHMILVPRVSSFRRLYIPIGFVPADWVASDAVLIIPEADASLFALLTSGLHMLWVRSVAGRLKSDFRYSASVVYNNFPFPELTEEERALLRRAGERILSLRESFAGASLAFLYDAATMPEELREAHRELNVLVETIYGCAGRSDDKKLEVLFARLAEKTGEME